MTNPIKKIAIIGMGVAGVSALREWTKQKEHDSSIELTAFGDAETFGRGIPYQKDDLLLIMNQPAELATIIPEKKEDFVEWLEDTQGEKNPRDGYYPRPLFGQYLYERMNTWIKQSNVEVIKERVVRIEPLSNKKLRVYSASTQQDFDVVHLCIGSPQNRNHYKLDNHPNFILDPFPVEKQLADIPHGVNVGVLGTGLTGIDILRYLNKRRPDIKLSFFSRSGRFKTARGETISYEYQYFTDENIKKEKAKNNGFIPLATYVEWFKKELAYQEVILHKDWFNQLFGSKETIKRDLFYPHEIGVVQTLLLGMDPFLTEIWMALTEKEKQTFFDRYAKKWDKIRSSFPVESGKILLSLWDQEKIEVYSNVSDIKKYNQGFQFIFNEQQPRYTEYLVNATAGEKNVTFETEGSSLLQQLLNERILQSEPFGGVQVTVPFQSAISQKHGVLDRLKVHGPLISGIQFGNNSIDIISEGVQKSVSNLVEQSRMTN